jgi:hypothetical protein
MKKNLLFLMLFASVISYQSMGQSCGRVSLIGEFNKWAGDLYMDRNPENPALFTAIITLDTSSNVPGPGATKDTSFMKFRENGAWDVNWGSNTFPNGIGTPSGPNIPVPIDTNGTTTTSYYVTFNCSTGAYTFTSVCGTISLIGEFNNWAGDLNMKRDAVNLDLWTTIISLDTSSNQYGAIDTIELKFRESGNWAVSWGNTTFPSGIGTLGGPNIKVPIDTTAAGGKTTDYLVTFNCSTGEYNFEATHGPVSLIGEFNNWAGDLFMNRLASNPDMWEVVIALDTSSNGYGPTDTIELKFRENADWGINWGGTTFPSGVGTQNGSNIKVPIDTTGGGGKRTDYYVTFNSNTGEYNFVRTWASMAMIGAFNAWNGDVPMNRDAANPNLWKLSRSWYIDSQVKFRANGTWTANWGNNTFPTGTGTDNGPNIPLTAGKYDVTFNSADKSYSFVTNNDFCGEIGIIGSFNLYGIGNNSLDSIDLFMVRDPLYPSQFSVLHNFTASDSIWFRLDRDPNYENVWGGNAFPIGIGQPGILSPYIKVPAGKYIITFNCQSYEYSFTRLGNAVTAPKVFAMAIDGNLNEPDWKIDQPISQVIDGTPGADLNTAYFGVTYNADFLFVGINITDAIPTLGDAGEVFIDGNKSGGAYDASDIHLKFSVVGVEVIWGPPGITVNLGFLPSATGYSAEVAIPWAALGVTAAEGGQVGFDIILWDDDTNTGVEYKMAWNGSLDDYTNTSSFGDLLFGVLSCGCISLYNTTVGDVVLQNPSSSTTTYVGSYELFENQDLNFRKDLNGAVTWGNDVFPDGTATLGGSAIPATTGRYWVTFDCITGNYSFAGNAAGDQVAYSVYTDAPAVIDGDLSEYTLSYNSAIVVEGVDNNTVTWGSRWDMNNLYLGVHVVDALVGGTDAGSPWQNDAVEYYIDGNHDRDGAYDKTFDTQLVQDFANATLHDTALWLKADGVQLKNWSAKWVNTSDGYSCELRLGWDGFQFLPGKGRSIGFSLGNDDNSGTSVRTGQSVWYGSASNWSNTAELGDLQLKDGPYFFNVGDVVDYSDQIVLFPNPSAGNVYLRMISDTFKGNVTIYISDITGRTIVNEQYNIASDNMILLDASQFTSGIYFVNILGQNGERATKKLIIH